MLSLSLLAKETVIATEFCLVRTESGLVAPTVDVVVPWGIELLTVFAGCSDKPVAVCVDVVGTVVSCRSVENTVVCGRGGQVGEAGSLSKRLVFPAQVVIPPHVVLLHCLCFMRYLSPPHVADQCDHEPNGVQDASTGQQGGLASLIMSDELPAHVAVPPQLAAEHDLLLLADLLPHVDDQAPQLPHDDHSALTGQQGGLGSLTPSIFLPVQDVFPPHNAPVYVRDLTRVLFEQVVDQMAQVPQPDHSALTGQHGGFKSAIESTDNPEQLVDPPQALPLHILVLTRDLGPQLAVQSSHVDQLPHDASKGLQQGKLSVTISLYVGNPTQVV